MWRWPAIITVLALVTGLPLSGLAVATAWLSVPAVLGNWPPASPGICPGRRWLAPVACGPGERPAGELVALAATLAVGVALSGMAGRPGVDGRLAGPGFRRFATGTGTWPAIFYLCLYSPAPASGEYRAWLQELTSRRWIWQCGWCPCTKSP